MIDKWGRRMLELAAHVATWSKDPSTQVGAVIMDADHRVIGLGYNGFPRGVNDDAARYEDREVKYKMVVHAEANAILNATKDVRCATLFCTQHPCSECAKLIIQSGLCCIVTYGEIPERWAADHEVAKLMLLEAGIQVHMVKRK